MTMKFKKHLVDLKRVRTSLGRDMESGLCLDRNERVTPLPQKNLEEIRNLITSATLSCYPEPDSLYCKLAQYFGKEEGNFYITNGITEAIHVIYETLTNPGDEVIVIDPTFPMYSVYAKAFQVNYKSVGFNADLSLKTDQLYEMINDKTAFVCLPNPNLPIESYLSVSEIKKLVQKCKDHNVWLFVDEAYGCFGAESAVNLIDEFDNLILFQTFSKAYGMAGIRVGFMVGEKNVIDYLAKTRSLVESNGLSMAIAEYMLEHSEIMGDYVRETKLGRDFLREELDSMKICWYGGDYTNAMLIFLQDADAVKDLVSFLKQKKIYIRASFEAPLDRCVRLTLGPKAAMEKFLEGFREWKKLTISEETFI